MCPSDDVQGARIGHPEHAQRFAGHEGAFYLRVTPGLPQSRRCRAAA
jgi:hypothetical protein